jgi:hypothetical protein
MTKRVFLAYTYTFASPFFSLRDNENQWCRSTWKEGRTTGRWCRRRRARPLAGSDSGLAHSGLHQPRSLCPPRAARRPALCTAEAELHLIWHLGFNPSAQAGVGDLREVQSSPTRGQWCASQKRLPGAFAFFICLRDPCPHRLVLRKERRVQEQEAGCCSQSSQGGRGSGFFSLQKTKCTPNGPTHTRAPPVSAEGQTRRSSPVREPAKSTSECVAWKWTDRDGDLELPAFQPQSSFLVLPPSWTPPLQNHSINYRRLLSKAQVLTQWPRTLRRLGGKFTQINFAPRWGWGELFWSRSLGI